jgi:hypothetical protein
MAIKVTRKSVTSEVSGNYVMTFTLEKTDTKDAKLINQDFSLSVAPGADKQEIIDSIASRMQSCIDMYKLSSDVTIETAIQAALKE